MMIYVNHEICMINIADLESSLKYFFLDLVLQCRLARCTRGVCYLIRSIERSSGVYRLCTSDYLSCLSLYSPIQVFTCLLGLFCFCFCFGFVGITDMTDKLYFTNVVKTCVL